MLIIIKLCLQYKTNGCKFKEVEDFIEFVPLECSYEATAGHHSRRSKHKNPQLS